MVLHVTELLRQFMTDIAEWNKFTSTDPISAWFKDVMKRACFTGMAQSLWRAGPVDETSGRVSACGRPSYSSVVRVSYYSRLVFIQHSIAFYNELFICQHGGCLRVCGIEERVDPNTAVQKAYLVRKQLKQLARGNSDVRSLMLLECRNTTFINLRMGDWLGEGRCHGIFSWLSHPGTQMGAHTPPTSLGPSLLKKAQVFYCTTRGCQCHHTTFHF